MTASDPGSRPASEPQAPLDRLLDLALYAPVGLALAARDLLPELAERGRRQLDARFAAARLVGRLAVKEGTRQADLALRRLTDQAQAVVSGARSARAGRPPSHEATDAGGEGAPASGSVHEPVPAAPPEVPVEDGAPALDPAGLSIPGYDTLSASQVVQRLPGLSAEELEAVRAYELAGRARKTILHKVAQLRAAS
ncbi:MAG TPA: hypothetical protein VG078_12375 [Acidimicrobiales bacterium]|nr:hypothetical protein [Acidimicrobiales bacterium]